MSRLEISMYERFYGVRICTDIVCQIPNNITTLSIGTTFAETDKRNSKIVSIKYLPEALTPEEAIKLTN